MLLPVNPLSPTVRAALVIGLLVVGASVLLFARRQARPGRIGGSMSRPKQVWLFLALGLWFVAAPALACDPAVSPPLRRILGGFALLMYARLPVELLLLYWIKRWTPPMGISHDAVCFAWMVTGLALWGPEVPWPPAGPADQAALLLVAAVVPSLLVEIHHAYMFHVVVGERTKGDEAVWFASADDPRFRYINRSTLVCDVPLVLMLAGVVLLALRG